MTLKAFTGSAELYGENIYFMEKYVPTECFLLTPMKPTARDESCLSDGGKSHFRSSQDVYEYKSFTDFFLRSLRSGNKKS